MVGAQTCIAIAEVHACNKQSEQAKGMVHARNRTD